MVLGESIMTTTPPPDRDALLAQISDALSKAMNTTEPGGGFRKEV